MKKCNVTDDLTTESRGEHDVHRPLRTSFARSQRIMRPETNFCALTAIFAYWNKFLRHDTNFCALTTNFARSQRFMRTHVSLLYLKERELALS